MPTDCGSVVVPDPDPDPQFRILDCAVSVSGDGVIRGGGGATTFTATVEVVGIDANRVQLTPSVGAATLDTVTFQDEIGGPGTYELETTQSWIFSDWRSLDWSGVPADGTQTVTAGVSATAQELNPRSTYSAESNCGQVEVFNDAQDQIALSVAGFDYPTEVRPGETISWSVTLQNDGTQPASGTLAFQSYNETISSDSLTVPAGGQATASGSGTVNLGGFSEPGEVIAAKVVFNGDGFRFTERTAFDPFVIGEPPAEPEPPSPDDVQISDCAVRDGQITDADTEVAVGIKNFASEPAVVSIEWTAAGQVIASTETEVGVNADLVVAAPVDLSGLPPGEHDVSFSYGVSF